MKNTILATLCGATLLTTAASVYTAGTLNQTQVVEPQQPQVEVVAQQPQTELQQIEQSLERAMAQCTKEGQVLENMDGTTPRHEVEVARNNMVDCMNKVDTFQF